MTAKLYTFGAGDTEMEFLLHRSNRKSLGITVEPDTSIVVRAPASSSIGDIEQVLKKRASWILEKQAEFELFRPITPPRQFLSGETFRYLAREYRLRVDPGQAFGVKLTPTHIVVGGLTRNENGRVRNRLLNWYRQRAKQIFADRLTICLRAFSSEVDNKPRLSVRPMEKRWGSLTTGGKSLILNVRLIEASERMIDYVIFHELCHFIHPDHGVGFYGLLDRKMPDWRKRKLALEKHMI
ncbi:M48 family metallopeptidase [Parasphingorhabdus sp. NYA22]